MGFLFTMFIYGALWILIPGITLYLLVSIIRQKGDTFAKRIIFYLLLLLIIYFVHNVITENNFNEYLAASFVVAELLAMLVLIIDLYKKVKTKYIFILLLIPALFAYSQVDVVPERTLTIVNYKEEPIENILVIATDYMGEEYGIGLCEGSCGMMFRSDHYESYYLTDKNGKVSLPLKINFGQHDYEYTTVSTNERVISIKKDIYNNSTIPENLAYPELESKSSRLDKERYKDVVMVLEPKMFNEFSAAEYAAITNPKHKANYNVYYLFYKAVNERNPEVCKEYGSKEMQGVIRDGNRKSRFFYYGENTEYKCKMFVGGALNGNPDICMEIENEDRSNDYKDQCKCMFGEEPCMRWGKVYDEYDKSIAFYRLLFGNPDYVHKYLCDEEIEELKNQRMMYLKYRGDMLFLSDARRVYQILFCSETTVNDSDNGDQRIINEIIPSPPTLEKPCEVEEILPCEDSDGGIDYYTKGIAGQKCPNGEWYIVTEDTCQNDVILQEKDCGYENGVLESHHNGLGGGAYKCPNGCSDGACIKIEVIFGT